MAVPAQESVQRVQIMRIGAGSEHCEDLLAVEEPLEIRIAFGPWGQRRQESIAVTMRTPGHDFELALGFLFTEGILGQAAALGMRYTGSQLDDAAQANVVLVELPPSLRVDMEGLSRHFYTASNCGICGKASLDLVQTHTCYQLPPERPLMSARALHALPGKLREAQAVFAQTGGLHAAALFDPAGELLCLREDVGRHNALDKVIGASGKAGGLPLSGAVLLVSGRVSFELVQKAVMAGIPFVAAIGAPSSLALDLAQAHGMTLVGFLRADRFNVYCGAGRIGDGPCAEDEYPTCAKQSD